MLIQQSAPEPQPPFITPDSYPDLSPDATIIPEVEEFLYIHVSVTDAIERVQIHKTVCNIVRLPRMQQICTELYKLMKNRKVLCTINPEAMLAELRRIGMPSAEEPGFSDPNFYHYYRTPKFD